MHCSAFCCRYPHPRLRVQRTFHSIVGGYAKNCMQSLLDGSGLLSKVEPIAEVSCHVLQWSTRTHIWNAFCNVLQHAYLVVKGQKASVVMSMVGRHWWSHFPLHINAIEKTKNFMRNCHSDRLQRTQQSGMFMYYILTLPLCQGCGLEFLGACCHVAPDEMV